MQGRAREGWLLITYGIGAWATGNIIWAFYELVLERSPFPSFADIGFMLLPPLVLLGFFRLNHNPLQASERVRLGIDALIIVSSAAVFSWHFLLAPTLQTYGSLTFGLTIALVYPILDLLLIGLLAAFVLRPGGWLTGGKRLFGLGLLGFIAADSIFLWMSVAMPNAGEGWCDPVWSICFVLFALTAKAAESGMKADETDLHKRFSWITPYLPYVAVISCCMLAIQVFANSDTSSLDSETFYGTILVTTLVVVRQILALRDNTRLTLSLKAINGNLERLVEERAAELRYLASSLEVRVQERTAELEANHVTLARQAQYDSLTDLPNRLLLQERLILALSEAKQKTSVLALLFIDLDGFKSVNDTLGHHVGDALLRKVAKRLTCIVRSTDTVARLGGDEFVIMLTNLKGKHDVEEISQSVLQAICDPFDLQGTHVRIGSSIGISLYPDDGLNAETLLQRADQAMYSVKLSGKKGLRFYQDSAQPLHGRDIEL